MAYKVLEQNGVTNENVDGAGFNYFASGKRDGILGGILSECAVYSPASNIVSISTGVISVQGFRVKITSDISWAVSGNADEYSIIFEIILNPDRSVSSQFIAQSSSLNLIKDDLLVTEKGTHQIEVIRFNWDGIAVSNISRRLPVIIAGSGGGGASVEIVQETGESESAVMSQKATTDALAGKVDKIDDNWKAYTTDGSGKTVAKPLAAKPSSGGVVLYNEGGIVKTSAPVEDNDAANKKFVEDGLAGKLDAILPSEVTAEYAYTVTPYGNRKRFMSGVENGNGNIVVYRTVSDTDKKDKGATINVTTPVYPYNAANRRFVENTVAPMQRDIRALNDVALGKLYTFEIFTFTKQFNDLPSGVLAHAYVRHIGPFRLYLVRNDGEKDFVGTANTCTVIFRNVDGIKISEFAPTMGEYFEIPEGAKSMYFEPVDISYNEGYSNYDNVEADFVVEMQVKVGG